MSVRYFTGRFLRCFKGKKSI